MFEYGKSYVNIIGFLKWAGTLAFGWLALKSFDLGGSIGTIVAVMCAVQALMIFVLGTLGRDFYTLINIELDNNKYFDQIAKTLERIESAQAAQYADFRKALAAGELPQQPASAEKNTEEASI